MTSSTGKVICELELDSGNQILASLNFVIVVEEGAMAEDEKASVSDLETYQEMIESAKEAQAVAEDAMAIVKAYGLHAVETTLLASKWVGDAEPFEYDLGSDYKGMVAYIVPTKDATDAQLETWRNARIYGDLNSTKIYAKMAKPSLDIPVDIIYTGISTGGDK